MRDVSGFVPDQKPAPELIAMDWTRFHRRTGSTQDASLRIRQFRAQGDRFVAPLTHAPLR